jgi:hypothetical protein
MVTTYHSLNVFQAMPMPVTKRRFLSRSGGESPAFGKSFRQHVRVLYESFAPRHSTFKPSLVPVRLRGLFEGRNVLLKPTHERFIKLVPQDSFARKRCPEGAIKQNMDRTSAGTI